MLFATYQPYNPDKDRRSPFYQIFEDYLGWYPVWCFKADTLANFLFGSWSSAPTCPERLIFFESDDYIEYDVVKYNQLLCSETLTKDSLAECFENPGKFKEVIVNDIPDDSIEMDIEEMMFEFDCEDGIREVTCTLLREFMSCSITTLLKLEHISTARLMPFSRNPRWRFFWERWHMDWQRANTARPLILSQ